MLPGGTSQEAIQLNIESLWSGGPFQDPVCSIPSLARAFLWTVYFQTYNGGNKQPNETAVMAIATKQIRQTIFTNSTGEIDS
jgi:alpha-L-fucosidase 2